MVKKYFSISIARHGENRVVQYRRIDSRFFLKICIKNKFSIFIAKHGENRVVQDRTKWSKIGGLSVRQRGKNKLLNQFG